MLKYLSVVRMKVMVEELIGVIYDCSRLDIGTIG
jgi:hypothetical protein